MKNNYSKGVLFLSEIILCFLLVLMSIIEVIQLDSKVTYDNTVSQSLESKNDKSVDSKQESTTSKSDKRYDKDINDDSVEAYISELLTNMTLNEKVAQMFIITPEALVENQASQVTEAGNVTKNALKKYPVGGLIYFSGNFKSEKQTKKMLKDVQELSEIPLFLGVDEEGGEVARIANSGLFDTEEIPPMGDLKSSEEAYFVGKIIGSELDEIGFNLDFAPIADVNSNPDNPVIGKRAFSTDAKTAAKYVAECVTGFKESGILCTLKHFPGHGDTKEDSHTSIASINKSLQELEREEYVPFIKGIEAGADLVMVGHISITQINETPATMSEAIVNGILRGELEYDGLVITDAMNMGAITSLYSSGEAAVNAINAGCDLLLMPENFVEAYKAVISAVKNEKISEERIDQSVNRVLRKKIESGIIEFENVR